MTAATGNELTTITLKVKEKRLSGVQGSHVTDIPPNFLAFVGTWGQFCDIKQNIVDEFSG